MDESFHYDVFLSYNRSQRDWVFQLARRLKSDGFSVWLDEWVLPQNAGESWVDSLINGVEQSRKIVLVWSPEFFSNSWPEFEATIIQQMDPIGRQQRVIPLLHTPCVIPKKWGFRRALDFSDAQLEFEFHYHHLIHNLDPARPYEGDFEAFKEKQSVHGYGFATRVSRMFGAKRDGVWRKVLRLRHVQAVILIVVMALCLGVGYLVREGLDERARRQAEPQLLDIDKQILGLRSDYEALQNSQGNRGVVNSQANDLLRQLLSINDTNLSQGMQIFKYEHACYLWGIVAGSEFDSTGRVQASENMLKACNNAWAIASKAKRIIEWMKEDDTEARISRLSAVGSCTIWQINRSQSDLDEFHKFFKQLPPDYVTKEHPEQTGELKPCVNAP